MRALIQRVSSASVSVNQQIVGEIGQGLLVLLGIEANDTQAVADKLLNKLLNYRVFSDENDKMNISLKAINGGCLIVSQFTLAADTQKGLRPSFSCAAEPKLAEDLYQYFVEQAKLQHPEKIATGIFAANMQVALVNDGPVTFLLDVQG